MEYILALIALLLIALLVFIIRIYKRLEWIHKELCDICGQIHGSSWSPDREREARNRYDEEYKLNKK